MYKALHKYSGEDIDSGDDVIPVYMREENKVVYGIIPNGNYYYDCPIGVEYEGDRYNGNEFVVYDFNDPIGFLSGLYWDIDGIPYYEHNFTDTISLGNHLVKRYNGTWLSNRLMLVEGIGPDTQISGYTLFISYPIGPGIPWFFFSHLIENDEIVYKGLCYRGVPDGIDEVVADKTRRPLDPNYYNLMGQPVGKDLPTTPGIYIHQGKKIVIR